MIITGKIVDQIEINDAAGDVFYELVGKKPYEISTMSSDIVQGCYLHEGEWGKVGCIISFDYTLDGKTMVAKEVVEVLDDENKTVIKRVFQGDLMEDFKTINVQFCVETHGVNKLVTWTLEYEKWNKDVPEPASFMELLILLTKDIESHYIEKK